MTAESGEGDFERAAAAFAAYHERDPAGREASHSRAVVAWVERLQPDSSAALGLAARAQHMGRWEIPRDRYPRDRSGYLQWRRDLAEHHADKAGILLADCGYRQVTIDRVRSIMRKRRLATDPEAQTLEDALCLAFIERQLDDFRQRHDEAKLQGILRKTWAKMSPAGHAAALSLDLPQAVSDLLTRSLMPAD